MPIVAGFVAVISWLARLGPWLAGAFGAFFAMLGVQQSASRILGIVTKWAIILAVAAIIPLPQWLTDLPEQMASLPNSFFWFAGFVKLRFGIYVVCSAYVMRWGWRIFTRP